MLVNDAKQGKSPQPKLQLKETVQVQKAQESSSLSTDLLADIIRILEDFLEEESISLSHEDKAEIITQLYSIVKEKEAPKEAALQQMRLWRNLGSALAK